MTRAIFIFVAALVLGVPISEAKDDSRDLLRLTRELQLAQSLWVSRGGSTHDTVMQIIDQITAAIGRSELDDWDGGAIANALALYVLSGGSSEIVRSKASPARLTGVRKSLVHGVIAFAEGRRDEARRLLEPLNPFDFAPIVGGHLALVQAALVPGEEPAPRLEKLSISRLLFPGSIAEEFALRRGAEIASSAGRYGDALFFLEQYERRFAGSPYGEQFHSIANNLLRRALLSSEASVRNRVIRYLAERPAVTTLAVFEDAAEELLRGGKVRLLTDLSRALMKVEDNRLKNVASLFAATCSALDGRQVDADEALAMVNAELLSHTQRDLFFAVKRWSTSGERTEDRNGAKRLIPDQRPRREQTGVDSFIAKVEKELMGRVPAEVTSQ